MLEEITHRPWPMPAARWVMRMSWHDLLFAHWPVPVEALRPHVPSDLEIDTYDGRAWIGVVPFTMTGVGLRYLPDMPFVSAFPEINVRTYVKAKGRTGVWFFSLDATSRLAVRTARLWYGLPYFDARIDLERSGERVDYRSVRTHRGAPEARFEASYEPAGAPYRSEPGAFDHWLTERYCLFAAGRRGRVGYGDIHHVAWPLQPARAEIRANTMTEQIGVKLPDVEPVLHFARRLDVVAWPVVALADAAG